VPVFLIIVSVAIVTFLCITGPDGFLRTNRMAARRKAMNFQNLATNAHQSNVPEGKRKKLPTLDEIHRRALEIHSERGDHDCDLNNYLDEWFQAERELKEEYNKSSDADSKKK
jgi:hypothetical protein